MSSDLKRWGLVVGVAAGACLLGLVTASTRAADGGKLKGKRVAILVAEGFEQSEMNKPRTALMEAGAKTTLIAPHSGTVRAWKNKDWGDKFFVDLTLDKAKAENFDALLIPGGVMSPDKLRTMPDAVRFVKSFVESGKPVAAICHGPWMLVQAGVVRGREVTSWPSLKTDIENAGGKWVDREVAVDHGLVTSRKPDDIPAFNRKMIEEFAEGKHAKPAEKSRR
jgi:protease I